MKLGFIGTGAITEHLITGMLTSHAFDGPIYVSQRSADRSARLSSQFEQVQVETDNQKIVDLSDWVFVAVLPKQAEALLSTLAFRPSHRVISMVAGRTLSSLTELCRPARQIFRIIPLPPIEWGYGPLPITPPNSEIAELFNQFGTAVEIENEDHFSAFSAQSSLMAAFFELVSSQAKWLEQQSLPPETSNRYTTSLFRALAEMAVSSFSATIA